MAFPRKSKLSPKNIENKTQIETDTKKNGEIFSILYRMQLMKV
jgi:hypothetical protein